MKVHNPSRAKYSHDYQNTKCPFCDPEIVKKQNIEALESKKWMVFINQYPILDGNLMLVLKRHAEDSAELTSDDWQELHGKIEQVKVVLDKIFKTTSFNIGFNIGPDSGASVKHLHWQILPRVSRQPADSFTTLIADIHIVRLSPEELKEKILKQLL